ncbi:hypothetical protein [Flavobacterium limnophilum]|uniref:hypothetical protein n=1 Tax=Flavobacterium limnophilum TaxID=3003262 RepID=UPI0022AC0FC7|nr:hypothetical protein [Flavobacterium limnophilum]
MKNKLLFLNLSLLIILNSCKEPIVTFEEAQPKNVKEVNAFPKKIIGNYYNTENKTELIISKYSIFKKMIVEDTLKISEIDKNEIIKNDSLFNIKTKEKYKIKRINDTLFSNYVYSDTIFDINKTNVLKKFKGYFFLNKLIEKTGFWEVEKLNLSKGVLTINGIETENELDLLQSITETKMDTIKPFRIKPTKKQFKEFIKKNGFTKGEIYLKK